MFYYVSQKNAGPGDGSRENPFRTIGQAADVAMPGDTIVIVNGSIRKTADSAITSALSISMQRENIPLSAAQKLSEAGRRSRAAYGVPR